MKEVKLKPKQSRQESGVILLTVIVLIIVLSVVVVSIMSLNISQSKTGLQIAHDITAKEFATGMFYKQHQTLFEGKTTTFSGETIDNYWYSPTILIQGGAAGSPNETNRINVDISY